MLNVALLFNRSPTSESPPKSPVRVSSRNEEQRYTAPPETNHVSSRGQNGDSDIQYVKATEVSSRPDAKYKDPIQVRITLYHFVLIAIELACQFWKPVQMTYNFFYQFTHLTGKVNL